jgi:hypothetical protein
MAAPALPERLRGSAFVVRLKDAVDLDSVRDDLAVVVSRALEPAHISVWISDRG